MRERPGAGLAGTLTLTGGCGGMGGAQPLAVTLNEGACLIVDVDESHLRRRLGKRYLDEVETDLDTAIAKVMKAKEERRGWSVGYVGNAATVFPEILRRHNAGKLTVDVVTDQTSAHDPLSYLPEGITVEEWHREAAADPEGFTKKAQASMAKHVQAMVEFQDAGAEVFDYGNSIRDEARKGGYSRAFEFPGFVPAYIRPLFCEGMGPFRWVVPPVTRRTSRLRTRPSRNSSRRTSTCTAGSTRPPSASSSRASRHASAGWATATAPRRGCCSTGSSRRARSRRPS